MNRAQWMVIAGALALFALLYWGFDTQPSDQQEVERSRQLQVAATDLSQLLQQAQSKVSTTQWAEAQSLSQKAETAETDSLRLMAWKELSGYWYQLGNPAIAGAYARKVAEQENTPEAWAIAGSTFFQGIGQAEPEQAEKFCRQQARTCFESAISLDPQKVDYRINLALTYVAAPPEDNPMKGILMLRDLSEAHPDNPAVLFQLGRLAVQTGQWEKARERLEQAVKLDDRFARAWCLLAEVYSQSGETDQADQALERCRE